MKQPNALKPDDFRAFFRCRAWSSSLMWVARDHLLLIATQ